VVKPRWVVGGCLLAALVGLRGAVSAQGGATLFAVHWNDANQRWRDIVTNPYAAAQKAAYAYESAVATVAYQDTASAFAGTFAAANLKPNFAYQIKLYGKPTLGWGATGDDWANEQLGYAGRWWVDKVYATTKQWVSGGNSTDSNYEYWKARGFTDGTYLYIFQGYLLFDWVVTDASGVASKDLRADSSLHVLWKASDRAHTSNDAAPTTHTVVANESSAWYGATYPTVIEQVYGEWEPGRPLPGKLVLPEGLFNVQLVLTEESFHEDLPDSGYWATVMACQNVTFAIQHESKPVKYWAVICGVANYKYINDLSYTDDDARDLAAALKQYPEWQGANQIEVLIDSAASKTGVSNAISRMGQKANAVTTDRDVCLLFFSGHGTQVYDSSGDEVDGTDEAICAWDTRFSGNYVYNVITDDQLASWLKSYLPGDADVVVILDTCFSGGMAQGAKGAQVKCVVNPNVPRKAKVNRSFGRGVAQRLAARGPAGKATGSGSEDIGGTNSVVLMACAEGGLSYETSALQNGVFSYYLIKGIGGPATGAPADDGDGLLAAEEDFAYAKSPTEQATAGLNPQQFPMIYDGNPYAEAILVHVGPPPPPAAEFSGSPTSGDAPLTVQFTDLSTGSITGWSWTFGDGGTSTARNPAYTYTAAGAYTVSLTVSGPSGSNTATRTNYITVFKVPTPSISGTITLGAGGSGLSGIQVKLYKYISRQWKSAGSTTTDAQGLYAFMGLQAGQYKVQPSSKTYNFTPASQTVTLPADDPPAVCDFTAFAKGRKGADERASDF